MRTACIVGALFCLTVPPLVAQTFDLGRITVGISGGLHMQRSLWDVPNQNVLSGNPVVHYGADTFHLHRDIQGGVTFGIQATRFSSDRFGLTLELIYLGLKMSDACTLVHDGGDPELVAACTYVGSSQKFGEGIGTYGYHRAVGVDRAASSVAMQGGVVLRPFKPAALQPYFKGMLGFATTPTSTVAMRSIYGAEGADPLSIMIYQDYDWKSVRAIFTVGGGVTSAPNSGLQVHLDVRETFLPLPIVTGASATETLEPPNSSRLTGILSVILGIDIVLQRARGKRY